MPLGVSVPETDGMERKERPFHVGGAVLGDSMTISGTVNKAGILLICVVATAAWSWNLFTRSPQTALPLLAVGGIGGFIVALVTIFKKAWSPVTATPQCTEAVESPPIRTV